MIWIVVLTLLMCFMVGFVDTQPWRRFKSWLFPDPIKGCTCLRCRCEPEHLAMVKALNEKDPLHSRARNILLDSTGGKSAQSGQITEDHPNAF